MKNLYIIKNGLAYDIEKLYDMTKPFSFKCLNEKVIDIQESDTPIFFARKRMKVSSKGKIKESYIHRYCVGKKDSLGKEDKHWLFADGRYDICGDKPSS